MPQNLPKTAFSGSETQTSLRPSVNMILFKKNAFFSVPIFIFLVSVLFSSVLPLFADADARNMPPPSAGDTAVSFAKPPSPPFPPPSPEASPFRPSIAVIVGVLTTIFSVTFLLLLYAKHCKRGTNRSIYHGNGDPNSRFAAARKNSGIDRVVIESLPIFRFGSLRGQKEGLECAVCLTRFELTEVLRLLPKCKHAFHVECVDTWLDAHSTCPLCRYRVDPEDILLIEDANDIIHENKLSPPSKLEEEEEEEKGDPDFQDIESGRSGNESEMTPGFRRISGRHSSAGERTSVMKKSASESTSLRRSLDSSSLRKEESVAVGCFDRYHRRDGLLVTREDGLPLLADWTKLQHQIIISGELQQRWSDVQPSDLLYLRSEMIINDSNRLLTASGSRPSFGRDQNLQTNRGGGPGVRAGAGVGVGVRGGGELLGIIDGDGGTSGRSVINSRTVSEITGINRMSNNSQHHRSRHARVVSRWLAWVSSLSQPAVRSDRTASVATC